MSDHNKSTRRMVLRRSLASLVVVLSLGIFLAPQSAFAQAVPPEEPQDPPAYTLPVACTDESVSSTWTQLQVTGVPATNNPALTWQWTAPTSENEDATFSGYGYALYKGDVVLQEGTIETPETVTFSYSAQGDDTYRFYVWINDTTTETPVIEPVEPIEPAEPVSPIPVNCGHVDTVLDTTGPIIDGNTYGKKGNTATPQLSTTETNLTYSWTTSGTAAQVTISDPTILTPIFRFLVDGTYTFDLVAYDALGNVSYVSYQISYLTPFVPTPEASLPEEIAPAPITEFIPPEQVLVQANKSVLDNYNYGATALVGDTIPDITANVAPPETTKVKTEPVVAPVESSNQGWLILGVPWYWWLLGVGIILSAVQWYRSGAFRRHADDL